MPYIDQGNRAQYQSAVEDLVDKLSLAHLHPGEVVYVLYQIISRLVQIDEAHVNFAYLNTMVGVLENTKLEFVKRVLGPYEDSKLQSGWTDAG
jgi:hypothetical protein